MIYVASLDLHLPIHPVVKPPCFSDGRRLWMCSISLISDVPAYRDTSWPEQQLRPLLLCISSSSSSQAFPVTWPHHKERSFFQLSLMFSTHASLLPLSLFFSFTLICFTPYFSMNYFLVSPCFFFFSPLSPCRALSTVIWGSLSPKCTRLFLSYFVTFSVRHPLLFVSDVSYISTFSSSLTWVLKQNI